VENNLEKITMDLAVEKFVKVILHPEGHIINPNQLIRVERMVGRRDPLTEMQQKIVTAAISLIHTAGAIDPERTVYMMEMSEFLKVCDMKRENIYTYLTNEIDKILKKGVFLYDEKNRKLTRTLWFQAIEYADGKIIFQFAEKILALIMKFTPDNAEYQLVKGLQYKGKYTLAVFDIMWTWKDKGVVEYSIPELMQQLSLEHTRYSYGQLKLRVLEPSLEEIYVWDDAIFVRFGPTFSGRRVEGVWFEVTTGEEATELRKKEPEFKFALPEQKPKRDCNV
jgi:plasmid replication initiation protein